MTADPQLLERAARNYPDSEYLQLAWLRAIHILRTQTTRGWLLDSPITHV